MPSPSSTNDAHVAPSDASKRPADGTKRAYVVVLAGDRMGETFPLNDGRTSIGRGLQADVRINDEGISRTHAIIERVADSYLLNDAGSTNGTFANGDRIDRVPLGEGDKIQIGATSVLRFTYQDDHEQEFQRNLYESALRDRLTNVFNRGYFNNRLESDVAFALRHGKPLSLLMIDVDGLRQFNDRYGNEIGDLLLRELAQRIEGTTRSEDIFARYGGEEFALICRDVDALKASRAGERVLDLIRGRPFQVDGHSLNLTVSLGAADLAQLREPSARTLVEASESALAAAKRQGKNRLEIFDPNGEPTRLV